MIYMINVNNCLIVDLTRGLRVGLGNCRLQSDINMKIRPSLLFKKSNSGSCHCFKTRFAFPK